jgi:hypothetical protein
MNPSRDMDMYSTVETIVSLLLVVCISAAYRVYHHVEQLPRISTLQTYWTSQG